MSDMSSATPRETLPVNTTSSIVVGSPSAIACAILRNSLLRPDTGVARELTASGIVRFVTRLYVQQRSGTARRGPCRSTATRSALDELGDRELLDVRRALHLDARRGDPWL